MVPLFHNTSFFVSMLMVLMPVAAFSQKAEDAKQAKQDTVFLEGFISSDQTLAPGKIYVLKHNVKVGKNATLTVPGNVKLLLDFNTSIVVEGGLNFAGSPGSIIEVTSLDNQKPGAGILIRG
ncbi:MAG TPA: hypothetical protein VNJ07_09030, partial [Chitinophagales bacterium]|nr:hypothetical protein [Chitinophagales bacterium]